MADAQLNALVADFQAKEDALASASTANDQAQAAAKAADDAATKALSDKNQAHSDLAASGNALIAYITQTVNPNPVMAAKAAAAPAKK